MPNRSKTLAMLGASVALVVFPLGSVRADDRLMPEPRFPPVYDHLIENPEGASDARKACLMRQALLRGLIDDAEMRLERRCLSSVELPLVATEAVLDTMVVRP